MSAFSSGSVAALSANICITGSAWGEGGGWDGCPFAIPFLLDGRLMLAGGLVEFVIVVSREGDCCGIG